MYLAGHLPFQLNSGRLINEAEILEDIDALLIVGQKLEVLIRHQLS